MCKCNCNNIDFENINKVIFNIVDKDSNNESELRFMTKSKQYKQLFHDIERAILKIKTGKLFLIILEQVGNNLENYVICLCEERSSKNKRLHYRCKY